MDLITLIQKEEERFINSPRIMTELLDGKLIITSKCFNCGDFKRTPIPLKILSLPIRQDDSVEYRIHMWHDRKILCFRINIDRNATLGNLKEKFENITSLSLNSYFLF